MPYFLGDVYVNERDHLGRTPLHIAAENRDPALAAFFIELGAQVNAIDNEGVSPLAISTAMLDAHTAAVLAAAGANIHHPMWDGASPALIALHRGNQGFFLALLHPATLSSTDSMGRTILHLAAEAGNVSAVNTILGAGSPAGIQDWWGRNPLDIALARHDSRDHAEVAERLILGGAVSNNPFHRYFAPAARTSNYNIRSADGMTPLHHIARRGYIGYLLFALERNASVNIQNASGSTPLHEAARSGNVHVMEILLNHGADINAQDANGNSVLHIGFPPELHFQAINLLLSRGANPDLRDDHGSSPLHVAVVLNRPTAVVAALLSAGAAVSVRDVEGKNALFLAVENNRTALIPLLLLYGSDIFAADNNGITPFQLALRQEGSLVYSLINHQTALQRDSDGNNMLHVTVREGGSFNVVMTILDFSTSILVNARNNAGDTSLLLAVRNNNREAGEILLHRGADIFAVNAAGESPLSLTFPPAGADHLELRSWMLTPQTLTMRDGLGNTPLHYAAQWRLDQWISLIVQIGGHTEAANATGETPLFSAVRVDSPSTVRALAANGALLWARDILGNSALHAALRWNAHSSAQALLDLGVDININTLSGRTPLHDSTRLMAPDFQLLFLQRGANIEARDEEGNTPLMDAVFAGNVGAIQLLGSRGADASARNLRGDTPLHIAVAMERSDLAALLLGWGASIHARNALNRTPFQNALGTPILVQTLLTGQSLYSVDDFGSSPLHVGIAERVPVDTVRNIIALGNRLSLIDAEGRTPVRLAVELGLWEAARVLADSGSDVFIAALDGRSAATIALMQGGEAVRLLFSGMAINARDLSGNTILHHAAQHGDIGIISQLLSLGAFREARNIAAESPADIAVRWNHFAAAAMLN